MKKEVLIKGSIRIAFCLMLAAFFGGVLYNQSVFAEDQNNKGLTLSPLRTELEISPGTSLGGVLTIKNSSKKTMTVRLDAEAFSVINQQYDYVFTVESNVNKWVSFKEAEIALKSGASKKVGFNVGVPLSAEPGGRYISLFASTNTDISNVGMESRQRVASLLYITVLGNVTREGRLVSLTSPWLIGGDSVWSMALQNRGSTHFRSRYNVKVNDLLWGGIVSNMSGESLILPGTIRLVSDNLPAPKIPGVYKAVYYIGLGDTPAVTKTRIIIYLPLWTTSLLMALAIFVIYWQLKKKLTKDN